MEVTVKETRAPGGNFYQVLINERFSGFTLRRDDELTDEQVIAIWRAHDIILQEELDYGGSYLFEDIDLIAMLELGAVRIVSEMMNGELGTFSSLAEITPSDDDDDFDTVWVRVVKDGYDPSRQYDGFSRVVHTEVAHHG